ERISFTMNNTGNVNIEHGRAINSNSNVLVANILETIIEAQNIPIRYAYTLVLVLFSNIITNPLDIILSLQLPF
ncbi:hypothetical protein, partial [Methanobrevibacter sp. UBA188]|uniref:hypothetical protein n=1 Tax=Methanobrevibacter sp. UBA188 TaxID=1915473 RepID=UPI0025CD5AC0